MTHPQKVAALVAGVGLSGIAYAAWSSYKQNKNTTKYKKKLKNITDENRKLLESDGDIYEIDDKIQSMTERDMAEYLLLLKYDALAVEELFQQRKWQVFRRCCKILVVVLPYAFRLIVWEYYVKRKIRDDEELQKRYAVELKEKLEKLGPCFVKLGQALSIRPDILPTSFMHELQKLTDQVKSYPTSEALQLIESELGKPLDQVFLEFDQSAPPISAASLGQVYRLHLKDENKDVAVKVQRPDMLHKVLKDVYILRNLAKLADYFASKTSKQDPFMLALIDKFASATIMELDYINESINQKILKEELESRMNNPWTPWTKKIYIPKVFPKYTTRKVITMEWIEGSPLARSSKEVINKLVPVAIELYLIQFLKLGFSQADPHPGNLLVTESGTLALIDFGLCLKIPHKDTTVRILAMVHLMQANIEALIQDSVMLNFLPEDVDRKSLVPELKAVFDSVLQSAQEMEETEDIKEPSKVIIREHFADISVKLNKVFLKYPFVVPNYFALIIRALVLLEGFGLSGDPSFDIFQAMYPFSFERAVEMFGYKGLEKIAKEAQDKMEDKENA